MIHFSVTVGFSATSTCRKNNDGEVGNNTNESQLHDTDSLVHPVKVN